MPRPKKTPTAPVTEPTPAPQQPSAAEIAELDKHVATAPEFKAPAPDNWNDAIQQIAKTNSTKREFKALSARIHTYFEPCEGIDYESELRLLLLWEKHWSDLGYETVVLNESHARKNPKYDAFMAHILTFPSVNGVGENRYEARCWQRHAAMEMVGGALCDYDVFPTRLTGIPVTDDLTLLERGCPSLISGTKEAFGRFVDFIMALPDGHSYDTVNGQNHASDMYAVRHAKLNENPMVMQFTEPGWASAPFVHFSHASTVNHRPRYKWISRLLRGEL